MEIEDQNIESNLLEEKYFKILYPNQNYELSSEYKLWKKEMEKNMGKNGKEIFCKKDNIIIYQKYEENDDIILCPICNATLYKCKYCSQIRNKKTKRCCSKALLKETQVKENVIFQNLDKKYEKNQKEFYKVFFSNFIPMFTSLQITLIFFRFLFLELENKKGEIIMQTFDKKNFMCRIPFTIFLLFYYFSMAITYSMFFYIIFIINVIISLPFNLYNVKIYLRFCFSII